MLLWRNLMLSSFSVKGYRTFSESVVISMRALPLTENQETIVGGYLPVVALFGPNGSGKSTLLEALRNFVEYLSLPLLSSKCMTLTDSSPSFAMTYTSPSYLYRYSLSFSDGNVHEEKLERAEGEDRRFQVLFSRIGNEARYHSSLHGPGDIPSDMPLLTLLHSEQPDLGIIEDAFSGINEGFVFPGKPVASLGETEKAMYHSLLSAMGFTADDRGDGLSDLQYLLPSLIDAAMNGKLLVADNLAPSLHPALRRFIVRLFTSPEMNRRGASLLFSTQDITLLDTSILRRDEIYFAEKEEGLSSLYRLADIRDEDGQSVRKDARLMKGYEEGLFGAYPHISDFHWKADEEKNSRRKLFPSITDDIWGINSASPASSGRLLMSIAAMSRHSLTSSPARAVFPTRSGTRSSFSMISCIRTILPTWLGSLPSILMRESLYPSSMNTMQWIHVRRTTCPRISPGHISLMRTA